MPTPIALPVEHQADVKLAISVDGVLRAAKSSDICRKALIGRLSVQSDQYIRIGEKKEAAVEFSCSIRDAVITCDLIRKHDTEVGDSVTDVYADYGKGWKKLPQAMTLLVDGALNRDVFDVQVEAVETVSLDEVHYETSVFQGSNGRECDVSTETKIQDRERSSEGSSWTESVQMPNLSAVAPDEQEEALTFDRDDAPEESVEFQPTFAQGQEHANGSWYIGSDGLPIPTLDGSKIRQPRVKKVKELPQMAPPIAKTFSEHYDRWKDCQLCPLGKQRSQIVLCRGDLPCDVLYCGEAPGVSEDVTGIPFHGKAGILLDAIDKCAFKEFSKLTRAFVNLVACFPREAKEAKINEPDGIDIEACAERLREIVSLAQPRLVVYVGTLSEKWFMRSVPNYEGQTVQVDHPAFILRLPSMSRDLGAQKVVVRITSALRKLNG